MARIDVITPVFNTPRRFVTAALDSLRQQTFSDWKLWVINDASDAPCTRELEDVLNTYHDQRIRYIQTDHKGPAGSRTAGISKGDAPYVAFLDSDDCWLPDKLARQMLLFDSKPTLGLVHTHYETIDSDGRELCSVSPKAWLNDLSVSQLFSAMLRENFIATSTVVVRRSALEHVGGFDDTFPCLVDKELWLRLLHAGTTFHYDSAVAVQYRLHPQNISKNTDLLFATRRRLIDKVEALLQADTTPALRDWPALKGEMTRHIYREAAEAHLEQGRYGQALTFSSPFRTGWSRPSCALFLRALYRVLRRSA